MTAYLILALGSLVFWALYQLAPMGLMLFSEHNINLNVYGIQVAPQWIQNINTLVIVVGGPLMAWWFNRLRARGCKIDIPMQFSGSLFWPVVMGWWRLNGLSSAMCCRALVN
jgi:POT family proton-dependent oligopeptide transporter